MNIEQLESFIVLLEYQTDKEYNVRLRVKFDGYTPKLLVPVITYQLNGWDEKYNYLNEEEGLNKYTCGWIRSISFICGEIYQARVSCVGEILYLQKIRDIKKEGGIVYMPDFHKHLFW